MSRPIGGHPEPPLPVVPGPTDRRRPRTSLAVRVALLVVAVAVLVATIAAVAGILVVRRSLLDISVQALSDRADLVATQIADQTGPDPAAAGTVPAATAGALDGQQIRVVTIAADGALGGTDQVALRAAREAGAGQAVGGASVSGRATVGGRLQLVEARSSATGGFALVTAADVAEQTRRSVETRLVWAVVAGLVAAVLIGLLIARAVSRPLRRTADLARRMGHGARDVRVPVTGPKEVADVSTAVNELADALRTSESRQREFLAAVSHELRTPIAGIGGQAQALADGLVDPAEQAQVGGLIQAEAARLEHLVSDLLDLARLGADQFVLDVQPVDLTALLSDMVRVWRPRCAAAAVPLHLQLPDRPVTVASDPRRVRQVLDGLADNALRVLPPGRPLVLALHPDGNAVVLQVRDGGPGLSAQDYPVAFVPGELHRRYRGRRPTGAGLGLALAHGLVQRLGGTIAAAPAAEGGVAVTVRLPAGGSPPGRPTPKGRPGSRTATAPPTPG